MNKKTIKKYVKDEVILNCMLIICIAFFSFGFFVMGYRRLALVLSVGSLLGLVVLGSMGLFYKDRS